MFMFGAGADKAKTFRPKRNHRVGTKRYELHKKAQVTLGAGNLHEAVTLPDGEDENEWLAVRRLPLPLRTRAVRCVPAPSVGST